MNKTIATDAVQSPPEFVLRLKALHLSRRKLKLELRDGLVRKAASVRERAKILAKTGGQCHVCGGLIEGNRWEADHVSSHSLGGKPSLDNCLPADSICNGSRWFYKPEEIQWILKLGVWLRKQIESETNLGKQAAQAFCKHDCVRASRRKRRITKSRVMPTELSPELTLGTPEEAQLLSLPDGSRVAVQKQSMEFRLWNPPRETLIKFSLSTGNIE